VVSAHSRRNYAKALDEFFVLWRARAVPLSRALFLEYRAQLLERGLASSTIDVRLSAIRKLVAEARHNGWIDAELAAAADEVANVAQRGNRIGNWLTQVQAKALLRLPDRATLKGQRDYVLLSVLVGCALRRSELAALQVGDIQQREGRWVLVDLVGKGRRVRSVPVPGWVKQGIDAWVAAAKIAEGRLLRAIHKGGRVKWRGFERLGHLERGRAGGGRARGGEFGCPRPSPYLRQALPQPRRRSRADQVPARPLLDSDHRELPGQHSGARARRQR
jgi:site-specific recombinase XerC